MKGCLYLNTCSIIIIDLVIDGHMTARCLREEQRDGLEGELSIAEVPPSLLSL